jgi:hypothetical protein
MKACLSNNCCRGKPISITHYAFRSAGHYSGNTTLSTKVATTLREKGLKEDTQADIAV